MARPLRIEFAGALYHVTSSGDGQEDIYLDDTDRKMYLEVLADVQHCYNWIIHTYCLTNLSEVPSSQKRQVAKPLTYYEKKYKDRNTAISKTYESGGYSLKEIGDYYNLHYSWVSRIVKANNKT